VDANKLGLQFELQIVGKCKDRLYEVYSAVSSYRNWLVPNNSIENLAEGVLQRVLFHKEVIQGIECFVPPLKPTQAHVFNTLRKYKKKLCRSLTPTLKRSYPDVISRYLGRKRERYEKACISLQQCGVQRQDSYVSVFLKNEKSKVGFVPRVVSPRSPRYNLELLTYLQELEHKVFRSIDKLFGDITVFKGMNSLEQGAAFYSKWNLFSNPVAISFDATRFDQHVSTAMLEFEHSIYLHAYRGVDKSLLRYLLSLQLKNNAFGSARNGKLRYKVAGSRMSGDVNTSLGNSIIMCGMVYSYCERMKIDKYSLANNGDDCTLFLERCDFHKFSQFEAFAKSLGFLMVVEDPITTMEEISFCQTHPVMIGGECRMIRDPRVALSKDATCLEPRLYAKHRRFWMSNVGKCGLSMSGGVPVFQSFYNCLIRSSKCDEHVKIREKDRYGSLYWLSRRMHDHVCTVSDSNRNSFYAAYGIDSYMQGEIENYYDNLTMNFETCPLGFQDWFTI